MCVLFMFAVFAPGLDNRHNKVKLCVYAVFRTAQFTSEWVTINMDPSSNTAVGFLLLFRKSQVISMKGSDAASTPG